MKTVKSTVALAVVAAVSASSAVAQLPGLPVYTSPKGATGLTINGDYGRCVSDCGTDINPQIFAARAQLGVGPLMFGVGAGVFDADVAALDKEVALAGTAALRVLGGPLMPLSVNVQAGVGYVKTGEGTNVLPENQQLTVPISVGVALNIPSVGFSFEPWIAPRIQFTDVSLDSGAGSVSNSDTQFGGALGVNLGLPIGLGFHAALDVTRVDVGTETVNQMVFGIGVHYGFNIPGL